MIHNSTTTPGLYSTYLKQEQLGKNYGCSLYQYKTIHRLSSKEDTKTEGKITVSHTVVYAVICEFKNY